MVSSSIMVELKLRESLFDPSFFSEKTVKLALFTHCISIGRRATGLPLGGLGKGMSQHYSTQAQVLSLISAEAQFEIKMKKGQASITFVFRKGTTGCYLRLLIR
jgi:hypothetical protein